MQGLAMQALMWIAPVVGLSTLVAVVLRWSGCPGGRWSASIAGGVVAGVLLGPSVAGRIAPEWRERVFVGSVEERRVLEREEASLDTLLEAVRATGVSDAALDELRAAREQEMSHAKVAYVKSQMAFDARRTMFIDVLLFVAMLPGGVVTWRGVVMLKRSDANALLLLSPMVPVLAFAVMAVAARVVAPSWHDAAMFALALAAVGFGPVVAGAGLGRGRDSRASIALGLAGALVWPVVAAVLALDLCGVKPILGAAAGVVLGAVIGSRRPGWRRGLFAVSRDVGVPSLACAAMLHADLHVLGRDGGFWGLLVLVLVISGDVRWLVARGMVAVAGVRGRAWMMSGACVDHGAAVMQVVLALVVFGCGSEGEDAKWPAALVIGALVMELLSPVRSWMAEKMDGMGAQRV